MLIIKFVPKLFLFALQKFWGPLLTQIKHVSVSMFLRDTLAFLERTNETGILVSLDQEKASNPVDRSFLLNILELLGFGLWFRTRIATVYKSFVYAGLG